MPDGFVAFGLRQSHYREKYGGKTVMSDNEAIHPGPGESRLAM